MELDYTGTPKDSSVCQNLGDSLPVPPDSQYCVSWSGVVLSNGQAIKEVGDSQVSIPIEYDYCYSSRIGQLTTSPPTSHDLYYYQGSLYNRDVFKNVVYKTEFGTCILNGTTLYHSDQDGNDVFVTDVKITYKGFPQNCEQATIGHPAGDDGDCAILTSMANANLDNCHVTDEAIIHSGKMITGYKPAQGLQPGQYETYYDCENAYVQRMAALNQCAAITQQSLRDACYPKVVRPFDGVTRVTSIP